MRSTEKRILHAAAEEFAAHGIGGARVARIAAGAGANKERIYHYFGNKEELFRAVLDDAMQQIVEAEPFAADDLGAYVAAMVEFHRRHPQLVRLLLAEARHYTSGRLPLEARRVSHYAARVEAVRRAQSAGTVRPDVDPRVVVYAVLALVVTAHALPQLTGLIRRAGGGNAMTHAELRDGVGVLLDGLLTVSSPGSGRPRAAAGRAATRPRPRP